MMRYEKVLWEQKSDLCLVAGDVTSTMACSIVACKFGVPVAHVEGGIRSGDWAMPEEINRVITDSISSWFFTTSVTAGDNLRRSGVTDERIFFVGNTMIDTLLKHIPRFRPPAFWQELGLQSGKYLVVTMHRPANVDDERKLVLFMQAIVTGSKGLSVVFPVHPRTAQNLRNPGDRTANIYYVAPQGYLEFNYLVKHAKGVITDSGGITEETTVMGVPCLTLRDNTERPETITIGTNELIGTNPENLAPALAKLMTGQWKKGGIPEKWDGRTAERIVKILKNLLNNSNSL